MTVKTAKFFIAKLTFLDRKDHMSSLDVWVGTRTLPTGSAWTGSPWIYGSILGLDGFGQSMGEVLPRVSTGTITLNTTRGSYEHHKSIVDLLDKYTILKQTVEVYSFSKHPDAVGDIADRELEFVGEVSGINYSPSSRTLAIEVQTREISADTPLRRITRDKAPNAPDRSIGRYLPLVFGKAQVPVYPAGTQSINENSYYFASRWTLPSGTFTPVHVNQYYYQQNGLYVPVVIDSSQIGFCANGVALYPYRSIPNLENEIGHFDLFNRLKNGTNNRILTSAYFSAFLFLAGGDPTTGTITATVELYEITSDQSAISNSPVRTASLAADEQTFTALIPSEFGANFRYANMYQFQLPFNQPYALQSDQFFYAIRIADSRNLTGAGGVTWQYHCGIDNGFYGIFPSGGTWYYYQREEDSSKKKRDWIKKNRTIGPPIQFDTDLLGLLFVILRSISGSFFNDSVSLDVSDIDAFGVALDHDEDLYIRTQTGYIPFSGDPSTISYTNKTLTATPEPLDISELPLIAEIQGVTDDASGTVTGAPDALIERGDHAVKLVWYLMKGSLSDLDTTTFSPATYIGNLSGATEARESYRDIISDLLYNTSSRLLPRRNGKLALWSYGVPQTPSFFLSESDCTLDDWTEDAGESLVNRVEIAFDRLAIPLNVEDLQTQASVNHAQTYTVQDDESIEFFGIRDLADSAVYLDWIRDPVQAERWARFVLETYSAGSIYVTFTVPFWKENYREIELYDIVCLNHIDIPSEYGSQSSNIAIKTEVGSTEDYGEGFPFRQSNNVFLRILSRSPRLTTNEAEATITFTGKVLRQREFK